MNPRKAWARIESGNFDLRFDDLLGLARAFGFQVARIRGSHHILVHSELPGTLGTAADAELPARRWSRQTLPGSAAPGGGAREQIRAEPMNRPDQPSRYHMHVFWSDEDQCWIAEAPDLRFCSAHGGTPAEAVAELEIAIAGWLETAHERGIPVPEPRYRPPLAG